MKIFLLVAHKNEVLNDKNIKSRNNIEWVLIHPRLFKSSEKPKLYIAGESMKYIRFVLNGCDISFFAEAPEDITLKQLLEQCDKIKPDWCACGICSYEKAGFEETHEPEIIIGYDSIRKADDSVSCRIVED